MGRIKEENINLPFTESDDQCILITVVTLKTARSHQDMVFYITFHLVMLELNNLGHSACLRWALPTDQLFFTVRSYQLFIQVQLWKGIATAGGSCCCQNEHTFQLEETMCSY